LKLIKKNSLALAAILITIGALWFTNRAVTPKESTWSDVVSEAKSGGYRLITTENLWKRYNTVGQNLLMVDTRQEWEFRAGHIKDAVNFPMEPTWLSRWQKKDDLKLFLGPDKDRTIIFY